MDSYIFCSFSGFRLSVVSQVKSSAETRREFSLEKERTSVLCKSDRRRALAETKQLFANQSLDDHYLATPALLAVFRDVCNSRTTWSCGLVYNLIKYCRMMALKR